MGAAEITAFLANLTVEQDDNHPVIDGSGKKPADED
jgi:hypothetical protein